MKKDSLFVIYSVLTGKGEPTEEGIAMAIAEVEKEINKDAEAKAKTADAYAALHDVVMGVMTAAPLTIAEIWEAIEDEAPEGATKGKVQYGLTRLWKDEVVCVEGKPNGYRKAV